MSRMMPAFVRAEGIDIYEKHEIQDVSVGKMQLTANVEGQTVTYDLDGENDFCSCDFFAQKKYCRHIAAVEEYLKQDKISNNTEPILEKVEQSQKLNQELTFGSEFLKSINEEDESYDDNLYLGVEIFELSSSSQFFYNGDTLGLTLKIKASRSSRAYIVKDIPQFLNLVQKGELYQLGKDSLVRLNLDNFDDSSKDFIRLLIKISPSDLLMESELYPKNGRFLDISYSFLEEILEAAYDLYDFKMTIEGKEIKYFSFSELDKEANIFDFKVIPLDDKISLKIQENPHTSLYSGKIFYKENIFYTLKLEQLKLVNQIHKILSLDNEEASDDMINFDYSSKNELSQALEKFESIGKVEANKAFRIKKFTPKFYFNLSNRLLLSVTFDYGDFEISSMQDLEEVDFSRDLQLEKKIFSTMTEEGFPKGFESSKVLPADDDLYTFFVEEVPQFEKLGEVSFSPALKNLRVEASSNVEISTSGSLLDIQFDLPDINDGELEKVIARLQSNQDHYITESGKLLLFDHKNFQPIRTVLNDLGDNIHTENGRITLPTYRTFQVAKIFENVDTVKFSEQFNNLYKDLTHPRDFPFKQPDNVHAELRHYQVDGVKWMKMLTSHHMGGILADDMGLGKTLQTITFLASSIEKDDKAIIVAPSSLIYNWESEFEKFAPEIDVIVVEGTKKVRDEQIESDHQVYVTSYGSFLKDIDLYQEKEMKFLFMDEAQTIKNAQSKTNKALTKLKVDTVFAISGTPIENRLDEMWALFNVVMPGLFASKKKFVKTSPAQISRTIKPFIMRRKKEDVLKELPDKVEMVQYNELADDQKVIYLAQLQAMQSKVKQMNAEEFNRSKIEILSGITRLRQICDTPALFIPEYTGESGKLTVLTELLEQIKESGHRPLIFSQFTKMFDFIEEEMEKVGLSTYKLTGSTPTKERLNMVKAFNAGSRDAFLISLKAGGMGLNLTGADVVILVDLWWNPSVEEQAISRAHRMGQKSTVEVIRLITKGTIEEKIQDIQSKKQDLVSTVLDGNISNESITEDEIKEILGL